MDEYLIDKYDGSIIAKKELKEKFEKNLQYPNGWAREFGSLEACIKAWFW